MRLRYLAVLVGMVIVIIAGVIYAQAPASSSSGYTWGPVQTGTVNHVYPYFYPPNDWVYGITETNGAALFIRTVGDCQLQVGNTIQYQISTYDRSISTEHIQVISPAGCVESPRPLG